MITPHDIIYCVLVPAGISLLLILVASRPWGAGGARGYWAGPIAIGVSFSIGLLGLQTRPQLPPTSAEDWLFHVGWMIAIVGLLTAVMRLPITIRAIVTALASATVLYLVLKPLTVGSTFAPATWTSNQAAAYIGLSALAMTVAFVLLEIASERWKDAVVPLLMTETAAALGLYMIFNGSQTYGQRAGIIAAAVGPVMVVALIWKKTSLARGGVMAIVALLGGLLATCYAYPDKVVLYRLLLIAAAPIIGLIPAVTPLRGWKRLVACALLAAILLGFAVVPAAIQFAHEFNAPKDGYSYRYRLSSVGQTFVSVMNGCTHPFIPLERFDWRYESTNTLPRDRQECLSYQNSGRFKPLSACRSISIVSIATTR